MIRPGPNDFLSLMTEQALAGIRAEALANGRIVPRIFFGTGCGSMMHIRLRFDDFVALAVANHRCTGAVPNLLRTMGFTFFNVALQFAEMKEAQPHLLTAEHANWNSTVLTLLRTCGPKFVVIVDHEDAQSDARKSSRIVAIGLHPTGIIACASTYRAGHSRGFVFDPIHPISAGAAQARGRAIYLKIFGPEAN